MQAEICKAEELDMLIMRKNWQSIIERKKLKNKVLKNKLMK